MKSRTSSGFTVLEILIVLAVFGLLATLAALSLNSARRAQRDAQRVSDVSVLRSAFSQYYLEHSTYPSSAGIELGKPGTNADAFTGNGFVARDAVAPPVYVQNIPVGPKTNEYYRYKGGPNGFSLRFQTEGQTALGKANVYYAHASGIDGTDEEK